LPKAGLDEQTSATNRCSTFVSGGFSSIRHYGKVKFKDSKVIGTKLKNINATAFGNTCPLAATACSTTPPNKKDNERQNMDEPF
jgi:CRISPR/Cas system CSM-associated protein Csm3 (group 7 of RAMP superfamily)